jgi:coniferyl-aldehyde dehydrogenase
MQNQQPAASINTQQSYSKHQIQSAREIFHLQQSAFKQQPYPEEKLRLQQLRALKQAILKHQDKLIKAVSADFSCRSADETRLADILPTIMSIDHAVKNLRQWMQPEKRNVGPLFQPAKARVIHQPKGVVGIMSPWNYPVFMPLGPLVGAIAAGNRAMIKPSEACPYSNRVINEIIQDAFSHDEVALIDGDAQVAAFFSGLPFDHLFFTGSTGVGRKVMAAAAQNLTPVTLELGGKSPAIIAPDVTPEFAVERILFGKALNAGQTCVAADYILCPEDQLEAVISQFKSQFAQLYPDMNRGDYSSIINNAHFERLNHWLQDAQSKGATVIPLATNSDRFPRSMAIQLVTQVNTDMTLMQEEIFGPLLPILTYSHFDQALQLVNNQPRPLALYLFTHDSKIIDRTLRHTHAGGVCINDTVSHVGQEDLPFGGIGPSGMGCYHAHEGFKTFSHNKAVFKRGRFNSAKLAFPPYGKWIHRLIYRWFL